MQFMVNTIKNFFKTQNVFVNNGSYQCFGKTFIGKTLETVF